MKRFAWIPEPVRGYLRLPLVRYRLRQERKTSLDLLRSLELRLSRGVDYEDYLVTQVTRSWKMRSYIAPNRAADLASRFLEHDKQPRKDRPVLCVGCRNAHELGLLRFAGFENVVGIDLFSTDAAILQMDMHAMNFPDKYFGVIFSCHSLEHSYDPGRVLSEYARVIQEGGVCIIEVPIRFKKKSTRTDLQDFGSLQGLLQACEPFVGQVLFAEEASDVARLIFSVAKPATLGLGG